MRVIRIGPGGVFGGLLLIPIVIVILLFIPFLILIILVIGVVLVLSALFRSKLKSKPIYNKSSRKTKVIDVDYKVK